MGNPPRPSNHLLASLPSADAERLRPHLRPAKLVRGEVLIEAGDPVRHVYFPHSGIISLVVDLAGGETVEVAMVGRDSTALAASGFYGAVALNRAIVQLPGTASVLDAASLRKAAEQSSTLRATLFRHEHIQFVQAQQAAACNACHTLASRLSRWLLRVRDLSGNDEFTLTQEHLAQMLAVRRSSVSLVARMLQQTGLIHYSRGRIEIRDLKGLKNMACECYGIVKNYNHRLLQGI